MQKEIRLYPAQYDFVACNDNYSSFIAGIGSGKTFAGVYKTMQHIASDKKTVGMIVAPTYMMLRDSTLRTFNEIAEPAIMSFNKQEMLAVMRGGHEIMFRSAEDPERLRGPNLNWLWIDEAGLTRERTWDVCIGRLRSGKEFGDIWITSTPSGKRHWLYSRSQRMTVFKASTLDNPNVSEEWKQSLLEEYTGNFLRQEVYGEFVSYEGLVYDMFDASVHVKELDLSQFTSLTLGIDFGYTNPTVILKVYKNNDGLYYVADEWYQRGKILSEIVEAAYQKAYVEESRPEVQSDIDVVVDQSAAVLIAELRNKGVGWTITGSKGQVLDGIRTLQNLFAQNRIIISPKCVNTIRDFESYIWKEGKDEPLKEFDHAPDALRYAITYDCNQSSTGGIFA
jgi:PBSX family phage terminase large subunit